MASSSSLTLTPISWAKSRSTSTRCASPHASCGETRRRRAIPCISTFGTTILSQPDLIHEAQRLPVDGGGPVFAEPWQAQAFALVVKLSEQGHFTWKEWAETLSDELKAAA